MQTLTIPLEHHSQDPLLNDLIVRIGQSGSLEEIILRIAQQHCQAAIFRMADDQSSLVGIEISYNSNRLMLVTVPFSTFGEPAREAPVESGLALLADDERWVVDEEWFDKRCERLDIRVDGAVGDLEMNPSSLTRLICS